MNLSKLILYTERHDDNYIGQIYIYFSEELIPALNISVDLNLTYLSQPGLFFNLTYVNKNLQDNVVNLTTWSLINFTKNAMIF